MRCLAREKQESYFVYREYISHIFGFLTESSCPSHFNEALRPLLLGFVKRRDSIFLGLYEISFSLVGVRLKMPATAP